MQSGREAGRDPYLRHCYSVSLDGGAPPVLLTPEEADHSVTFSPDPAALGFVDAFGRADLPAQTVLRSLDDGEVLRVLATADISALERIGSKRPTPFEGVRAQHFLQSILLSHHTF